MYNWLPVVGLYELYRDLLTVESLDNGRQLTCKRLFDEIGLNLDHKLAHLLPNKIDSLYTILEDIEDLIWWNVRLVDFKTLLFCLLNAILARNMFKFVGLTLVSNQVVTTGCYTYRFRTVWFSSREKRPYMKLVSVLHWNDNCLTFLRHFCD